MRPKPSSRRRVRPGLLLRRQPRLRWALAAVAALGTTTAVASVVERAERAQEAWGPGRPAVIITRDLAPGDRLDVTNTDVVQTPRALIPPGAPSALPPNARVRARVYRGEVLLAAHLAPAAATALSARMSPGTRAVAIPAEPATTPALRIGDRVDVLVALAPEAAGPGPLGFAVAPAAMVVDVSDTAITVAVAAALAPRIAVALGQGAVTLALVAP